jgi:hypothetical protein
MLTKYEANREVKDWLDLFPPTIEEGKSESGKLQGRLRQLTPAPSRVRHSSGLREIHLTPVVSSPGL